MCHVISRVYLGEDQRRRAVHHTGALGRRRAVAAAAAARAAAHVAHHGVRLARARLAVREDADAVAVDGRAHERADLSACGRGAEEVWAVRAHRLASRLKNGRLSYSHVINRLQT
jgi:hypothetical protein